MADNFVTNPGSGGSTFAADDVGGVLHPRVKLEHGADGSATDVSAASPLPAELRSPISIFRSLDLDESEEEVKSSAGRVFWIIVMNLSTSLRYLKLYSAPAASVTVGTTTPVMTIPIPPAPAAGQAGGFTFNVPQGIDIGGTGICAAVTTGLADNDTGAPGANEVVVNIGYI